MATLGVAIAPLPLPAVLLPLPRTTSIAVVVSSLRHRRDRVGGGWNGDKSDRQHGQRSGHQYSRH
ncbi:hypothetical protein A2J03_23955 [Rhodococcus sp. EPR-157]|nr:hypothetical protein A2J03_23955 [Rhodococcus sp. EPR-157]